MRYKQRFLCINPNAELLDLLERYRIKYTVSDAFSELSVTFFLYEDENVDEQLRTLANKFAPVPLTYKEYTKEEIANAEFLLFRPVYSKVQLSLDSGAFVYSCEYRNSYGDEYYGHMEQIASSVILREPVWKRRSFLSEDVGGYGQIYCNRSVVDLIHDYGLKGIQINPVYLRNGEQCTNTFQLTAQKIIPQKALILGRGEVKRQCRVCGRERFFLDSRYCLHLYKNEIDQTVDFLQTESILGEGIENPIFLISQRFYRLLIQAKLASHIIVEPVCFE